MCLQPWQIMPACCALNQHLVFVITVTETITMLEDPFELRRAGDASIYLYRCHSYETLVASIWLYRSPSEAFGNCLRQLSREVDSTGLSDGNAEIEEAVASGGSFLGNGRNGLPESQWDSQFIEWDMDGFNMIFHTTIISSLSKNLSKPGKLMVTINSSTR